MSAWDVLRGGTVVDTVYFVESIDREDVERALEHDGYVRGTFNAHPAEDRRGRRWSDDQRGQPSRKWVQVR